MTTFGDVHLFQGTRVPIAHGTMPEAPAVSCALFAARGHELYQQLHEASERLNSPHPQCLAAQRLLTRVVSEIGELKQMGEAIPGEADRPFVERMVSTLHATIEMVSTRLESDPCKELLREQKKWVDAGFPEEVLTTDPDAVHFAVSTHLLYTVLMYRKSAEILEGDPVTFQIADGKVLFKVEGEYVPYERIKEIIRYSESDEKFPGWNFIHPMGFVHQDSVDCEAIYPIAQLTPEAYHRVATTASHFWSENQEEIDPGREKQYVLQVMTTGRCCIPRTWWGVNSDDMMPEHSSSRLITPDGRVFSFGTKLHPDDAKKLTSLTSFLTTAVSRTCSPDYDEPRPSDEKRVTSIPITKERFDAIMAFANDMNKGFVFNFANQNCTRFVAAQMALAGVYVNARTTAAQCYYAMLPNLKDVPLVGRPLVQMIAAIAFVVTPIFDCISALARWITPYPVRWVFEQGTWVVTELFRRIGAIALNILHFFIMGGGRTLIPLGRSEHRTISPDDPIRRSISPTVLRWQDIANPDAFPVYHSSMLREWQTRQRSSVFFTKPECGLSCIDPADGWTPISAC